MGPLQPQPQSSIVEGSFLDSNYFDPVYLFNHGFDFFRDAYAFITSSEMRNLFFTILFLLATFFICIIFYSIIRLLEIRKKEHAHLHHEIEEYAHHQKEHEEKARAGEMASENKRWMKTLTYLFSDSSSDWKLAIIEADAMLEELMNQMGFKGETLGEKLKGTTQDKFRHLTTAWEVHAIRNRIAHEGLSYEISQHEAKRTIALYEKIFRDFGYI